jgi:hypothetical protein
MSLRQCPVPRHGRGAGWYGQRNARGDHPHQGLRDVTAFSIHTLGDWSLSTSEADYAGNYTLKKVKKKKKQGYAFNLALDAPSLDTLIDELGESVNQLCGRAPDTLAITQASVTKFIAKLSTDRTTLIQR